MVHRQSLELRAHHGNTEKVARAIAEVLDAEVVVPEAVDPDSLAEYDLVGFGSGVYFGRPHRALRRLVADIRKPPARAFVFTTSGLPFLRVLWHAGLKRRLRRSGCEVIGEFACRGWDTVGPLALVRGLHRGHPDPHDLERAREFARTLRNRMRPGPGEDRVSSPDTP